MTPAPDLSVRLLSPLALLGAGLAFGCAPTAAPARAPDTAGVHAERIALAHGQPKEVAFAVRELFPANVTRADGGRVNAVLAVPAREEIIVFGNDAGIAAVRASLTPGCTDERAEARSLEIVHLVHAEAQRVQDAVSPFTRGMTRVVVDRATNALVIETPTAAEMQRMKQLVAALDVAPREVAKH